MIIEFCGLSRCVTGGRGEGEKIKKKRLPYDLEYESLQGVSRCCAKTHRRTYHVTPDLRWHGQQLPYSSLLSYVFTEYSTCVDGILPHKILYKLFETTMVYLFHYAYPRTDCCRGGVHTVQQKHVPSSTRVELCLPTLGALSSWSV